MSKAIHVSEIILKSTGFKGETAIILGSGLGSFTNVLVDKICMKYKDLPHYPTSRISGHAGELVLGNIENKEILVASGRSHFYEGYSKEKITFPIRVFNECGIKNLIITNAAGSLKRSQPPGTIAAIIGHIDCSFQKQFEAPLLNTGPKYHSPRLISLAKSVAKQNKILLNEGNYCWTLGPMYETPQEINYFKTLNASVVGMSTLPEIVQAGLLGLNMLTLSIITNFAAGVSEAIPSHEEVLFNAKISQKSIVKLLVEIIKKI